MSPELLRQKAREICYAIIKVSYFIKRSDLRQRLERLAFEFLENAAIAAIDSGNPAILSQLDKNIAALDVLIRMGHSLYEIEPVNATILVKELDAFNSAIRQFGNESGNPAIAGLPDLESLFTTSLNQTLFDKKIDKKDKKQEIKQKQPSHNPASNPAIAESTIKLGPSSMESGNSAIRQQAITNKIRQFSPGLTKLKDLIAAFPDVSERTLRYDLQSLCEQGVIERIGNSGPNTFYRIKS